MEIINYGNRVTEEFNLYGKLSKGCQWRKLEKIVRRKLDILIHAQTINDLNVPPNNKFKWLVGNYKGYASIRINNQWRLIFKINQKNQIEKLQIIDYH